MLHHFPNFGDLRTFLAETLTDRCAVLLTDSHCLQHCWPELVEPLGEIEILEIEPGEASKDIEIAAGLWQTLLELHADRNTVLITLGGGVVTDLGGFVASTFKRGIPVIHIPTSLLGMVDAAVGGKTGINLGHSKNQVGTFYQAEAVCICPPFLQSLPLEQLRSGYAEMFKHALLDGEDAVQQLAECTLTADSIAPSVAESARFKQQIVEQDERESGLRKHLNLGHTVGHGLEGTLLETPQAIEHGTAVAWGILAEAVYGNQLGITTDQTLEQIESVVREMYNPVQLNQEQLQQCMQIMQDDKKNAGTEIRLVLLEKPGKVKRDIPAEPEKLEAVLSALFT